MIKLAIHPSLEESAFIGPLKKYLLQSDQSFDVSDKFTEREELVELIQIIPRELITTIDENGIASNQWFITFKAENDFFGTIDESDTGHCIEVSSNDFGELGDVLAEIQKINVKRTLTDQLKRSQDWFKTIKRKANDFINSLGDSENELTSSLILLENEIRTTPKTAGIKDRIEKFLNKQDLGFRLFILDENGSTEEYDHYIQLEYYPYKIGISHERELSDESSFAIQYLLATLDLSAKILSEIYSSQEEFLALENAFSSLPFAVVLLSSTGGLILNNKQFASLGILPKDCLKFNDREKVEIKSRTYKVNRGNIIHDHREYSVFYFLSSSIVDVELEANSTAEELGIISSSLAHELNNPIAGILTAIELLKMGEYGKDQLDDMEEVARRCKELVEIFLGFSRRSTQGSSSNELGSALDRAMGLLNSRMIESNIKLEVHKEAAGKGQLVRGLNVSIMAMIFYLVLNEVITAISRKKLVTGEDIKKLDCFYEQDEYSLKLKITQNSDYYMKVESSKLVQYLLKQQRLKAHYSETLFQIEILN